jgi:hypothetical protein
MRHLSKEGEMQDLEAGRGEVLSGWEAGDPTSCVADEEPQRRKVLRWGTGTHRWNCRLVHTRRRQAGGRDRTSLLARKMSMAILSTAPSHHPYMSLVLHSTLIYDTPHVAQYTQTRM